MNPMGRGVHTGIRVGGEMPHMCWLGDQIQPPPLTTPLHFLPRGKVLWRPLYKSTANQFWIQIYHMNVSLLAVAGRLTCPWALRAEAATLA